jgi:hypothetical protein
LAGAVATVFLPSTMLTFTFGAFPSQISLY